MRNLKRVLALALALVMMLGMMITASAATYADEAAIAPEYADAVEILTGMGVFQGTGAGFAPKATLSRAEAAALIYRVITADVDDKKVDLYDYSSFDDVEAGKWYTGYITYAANGGYLKGYDGKAMPNDKVTGVQVLAIMLRAAGYGQNGEYEGAAWMDNILTDAQDLGLLAGVNVKSLAVPATREVVAQLIFNAMTKAVLVTYTPALGYMPLTWVNGATAQTTLGVKNFGLKSATDSDEWGRPGTVWFDARKGQTLGFYALIEETPLAVYTTAVTECQVATDTNQKTPVASYITYTNGKVNADTDTITATQTRATIGAQGRLTEVYEDEIVYIDTLLAEVLAVKDATYDNAGHLAAESSITLKIYDTNTTTDATLGAPVVDNTTYTVVTETNGKTNYEYAKGDMVLVSAVQYPTNRVRANAEQYVEIQGLASSMVGAETVIWHNVAQHTVNGTVYNDAVRFHLDEAGTIGVNHTWYFDAYGNLISAVDIAPAAANYGVVTNLYWNNMDGVGAAYAVITYMDGTTETVKVASVDMWNGDDAYVEDCKPVYALSGDAMDIISKTVGNTTTYSIGISMWANDNKVATDSFVNNDLFAVTTTQAGAKLDAVAELGTATIKTGLSLVDGTAAKGATVNKIYTNSNTQYLVRLSDGKGGYTFEPITGFNNIYTYNTNKATVDYVIGRDGYVAYAFVTGTPDSAVGSKLVYVTGNAWQVYVDSDGITHYVVSAINIDGTPTTVDTTVYNVAYTLYTNVGKLYYVTYTGNSATAADEVTKWAVNYKNGTDVSAAYGKDMVAVRIDGAIITGDVLANKAGTVRFNVTGSTTYAGDLANIETNVAYLLLNKTTLKVTGVYVSTQKATATADSEVTLALPADEADVKILSNEVVYVAAKGTVTNIALVKSSGNAWGTQGVDSYTVTAADGTNTWTVENVKTTGTIMTFDLVAPATVAAEVTVELSWTAK